MDNIDTQIIHILRRDGRMSISDLALHLGLSRATIRSRFEALQAKGEIIGFTAVVKSDTHRQAVRGIVLIEVEGKGTERVIATLDKMPAVQAIHTTHGRWDLIVELGTDSLESLDEILRNIRLIDGISNSETNLYLATKRTSQLQDAQTRFEQS